MTFRIGINGFGRIGRLVLRSALEAGGIEVVGINDLGSLEQLAMLLKYDSAHGKFPGEITVDGEEKLIVNGKTIKVTKIKSPAELPWKELGVDIAIESTGVFTKKADCEQHLAAGAKRVVLTVPAKDEIDATIVLGVNDADLKPEHKIVSNASCTTNCTAPLAKVLHESFGIKHGLLTTVHAYTNDQRILDFPHKDPRRARAAAVSIIPTTTGAAKAVGKVIPALKGKLDGMAMRVPVPDGSVSDLVCELEKPVTVEEVNAAFKAAAEGPLKGILHYETDPVVSCDIIHNPHSCIFDSGLTYVSNGTMVKVIGWYDNEWGYSCRVVDLAKKMAAQV